MPIALLEKLPPKAQEIYESAYNNAKKQGKSDAQAAKLAIGAVKNAGYSKNERTGNWSKEMDNLIVKVRNSARTPSYDGTETTSWSAPSFEKCVAGYKKHTGDSETYSSVADLPGKAKTWIASKSLLGDAKAETFSELLFFPVVNPSTNKLNENALRAVIGGRGSQAKISSGAKNSAQTKARSLLQSKFDMGKDEEKSIYSSTYGIMSFDELDAAIEASTIAEQTGDIVYFFQRITSNILCSPELNGNQKAQMVSTAATEFSNRIAALVGGETKEGNLTKERLDDITSVLVTGSDLQLPQNVDEVKAKLYAAYQSIGVDAPSVLKERTMVFKSDSGTFHWLTIYSNNYRDDDYPQEILSAQAHRDFVKAVDSGEWPMPELWLWHIPIPVGKAKLVHFDESSGMAIAAGDFYKEYAHVAKNLVGKSLRTSHGMVAGSIVRNEKDPTIIEQYRSKEISLLPYWAAANPITGVALTKEKE